MYVDIVISNIKNLNKHLFFFFLFFTEGEEALHLSDTPALRLTCSRAQSIVNLEVNVSLNVTGSLLIHIQIYMQKQLINSVITNLEVGTRI